MRVVGEDQGGAAVAARAVEQAGALGEVARDGGAQARAERGGEGELVARLGAEVVGQGGGPARGSRVGAEELVAAWPARRRCARPRGGRRRPRSPPRGGPDRAASAVVSASRRRSAASRGRLGEPLERPRELVSPRLELGQLALEPLAAVLRELGQLGLERGDPLERGLVGAVALRLGLERGEQCAAAAGAVAERLPRPAARPPRAGRCAHAPSAPRRSGWRGPHARCRGRPERSPPARASPPPRAARPRSPPPRRARRRPRPPPRAAPPPPRACPRGRASTAPRRSGARAARAARPPPPGA